MGVTYWAAPEVEEIAEKLIAEHHTNLAGERIRYVFRSRAASSKGRIVLGRARKISGLNAHLVGLVGRNEVEGPADFFVVEIAADQWQELTHKQRVALVDHELCHFDVEEAEKIGEDRRLVMRGHDLEEFAEVVERHGLWRPPVEEFARVAGQLSIDDQLSNSNDGGGGDDDAAD